MKLKAIWHYSVEDKEHITDYYDIELWDPYLERVIATWGDEYHDNGAYKLEGFIQGVEWMNGHKVELEREDVADRDY